MTWAWTLVATLGCSAATATASESAAPPAVPSPPSFDALFAPFVDPNAHYADGFSAPLTREHPHDVRAMATGRVRLGDGILRVEHRWIENDEPSEVTMTVTGLAPVVADGAWVAKGDLLGHGDHPAVALEGESSSAADFAAAHAWAPVPAAERQLVLISHAADELRLYAGGLEVGRFQVGFGQSDGRKERQGDNRTPKGLYFIADKSTGPFGGPAAAYFGGYWMRVNYPNAFDAARALGEGRVSEDEARSIGRAWRARKETTKRTALGGGIGLHGWAYEWDDADSRAMSWGCVAMHLRDAPTIYAALDPGAMVILF